MALWPLGFRGLSRTLQPLVHSVSDYCHPLIASGYESRAWDHLVDALGDSGAGLIDLPNLSPRFIGDASLAGAVAQSSCAVLELPSTFGEYLQALSKSLRYDVRRIDKLRNLEIVRATKNNVDDLLEAFFSLHARRWRSRGLPGAFSSKRRKRFHHAYARQAVCRGNCRIEALTADGKIIGVIYAMQAGNSFFFYQSGFDPQAKSYSPGTLLVAASIRRAIEEGMGIFDFLRGVEPYKLRWQPQKVYSNVRWMWKTSGFLGDLERRKRLAAHRVESKLRERFEGRGLK